MKSFSKITLINLEVLLAYSFVIRLGNSTPYHKDGLAIAIASCFLILIQIIVNFALALDRFRQEKRQVGGVYVLNIFIVLIVGFGVCSVNSNMF